LCETCIRQLRVVCLYHAKRENTMKTATQISNDLKTWNANIGSKKVELMNLYNGHSNVQLVENADNLHDQIQASISGVLNTIAEAIKILRS